MKLNISKEISDSLYKEVENLIEEPIVTKYTSATWGYSGGEPAEYEYANVSADDVYSLIMKNLETKLKSLGLENEEITFYHTDNSETIGVSSDHEGIGTHGEITVNFFLNDIEDDKDSIIVIAGSDDLEVYDL